MDLHDALDQASTQSALCETTMATGKQRTEMHRRVNNPSVPPSPRSSKRAESEHKSKGGKAKGDRAATVAATERAVMIARAAYLRAERRGFIPGRELEDWLEAEREINHLLGPPDTPATNTRD